MGRVNMKKKAIAIVLSILMVAGNTGTVPVFAAETTQEDAAIDVTSVSSEDEQRVYEEGQTVENPSSQIEDEQPVPEEEQTVENPSSQNIDEQEAESLPVEEEQNESDEEETVADAEETVEEAGEADTDSETAAVIEPVTESVTAEKGGMSDKGVVKSGECGENARYTMTGSVDHITVTISGSGELYGCSEDNHPWSDYKNGIETVVIEEGITGIGGYMFYGCVNLRSVTMADSVTMIRQNAFKECTKLSTVKLPEGLIEIQDRAFQFCRSLTSIKIPEGVTLIGYAAFDGCSGLCSIELPDSLTRITGYSFCECSSLTSLEIPKSIIKIDEYAFTRCSSLTSFVIPEGVTSIGRGAFKNCSSLTDIEIPEEVTEIGYQAFYGCSSLAAIDLPEGMTEIGYETFSGCSSLTGIEIPEGVTSIGKYAFCNCSSLSGIEIPEGVQGINEATFYGCISLTGVEIPEGVTSIGKKAFYECSSLEEIIFPRSLKNIESNAFYSCNNLKELVFPEGLQSIGSNAFGDCQKLNTITVPGSATNIDGSAFKNDTEITAWYTVPGSYLTDHYPEYGAVYYLNDENAGKYCHIGFITDSIAVMSGDSFNLDEYIVTNLNLNECTVTLSDESNFIYDDGMIASISAGACNITVSNGETSATARIVAQDKPIGTAEKIAFNDSAITIARGQYSSNTLNITPGNSGIEGFEWYSSDETVVTVNRGILYAIGEGTATVTVMNPDHNEVSAECTVTVSVPLNDLIVIDPSIKIEKGKARQVLLYKYPSDNTDEISYTSSDDSIASVDQFGKVTGVGFGTAVITVKTNDGGKTAKCKITVNQSEGSPTAAKMVANLRASSLGAKKDAIASVVGLLISAGFEPAFAAGVGANVYSEGTYGMFESSKYIKNYLKRPRYFCYLDGGDYYTQKDGEYVLTAVYMAKEDMASYTGEAEARERFGAENYYRDNFSGKYVQNIDLNELETFMNALAKGKWEGKFGVGIVQWTGGRTMKLLSFYRQHAGAGSATITAEQVMAAENEMILYDFKGDYAKVYTAWLNENAGALDTVDAAYSGGALVCTKYEIPVDKNAKAIIRGNKAKEIYQIMVGGD